MIVKQQYKRRRDTRGDKNRRRMGMETEQQSAEIFVNLPKVFDENVLMDILHVKWDSNCKKDKEL